MFRRQSPSLIPLLVLLAGGSSVAAPQSEVAGASSTEQGSSTEPERGPRTLIVATHERLSFEEDVERVAVGRSETLTAEVLDSRQLLILAREPGRTSLVVWLAGGEVVELIYSVEPDLSILRAALVDIHQSITAEVAPDRNALVLRGTVPDLVLRQAAEAAAKAYLASGGSDGVTTPILVAPEAEAAGEALAHRRASPRQRQKQVLLLL